MPRSLYKTSPPLIVNTRVREHGKCESIRKSVVYVLFLLVLFAFAITFIKIPFLKITEFYFYKYKRK